MLNCRYLKLIASVFGSAFAAALFHIQMLSLLSVDRTAVIVRGLVTFAWQSVWVRFSAWNQTTFFPVRGFVNFGWRSILVRLSTWNWIVFFPFDHTYYLHKTNIAASRISDISFSHSIVADNGLARLLTLNYVLSFFKLSVESFYYQFVLITLHWWLVYSN